MSLLTAELRQTLYAAEPHLHLLIDGQPLDELLHQYSPDGNYLGLLPTLLRWLDHPEEVPVMIGFVRTVILSAAKDLITFD